MPSAFTFPHPALTAIVRAPTNHSLQTLQQELYANARAVHSTRGGGENGHLAIVMPPEAYLARTGHAFVPPIHPGAAPVHGPGATAAQITENVRAYNAALDEHRRYLDVSQELKKQVLLAVEKTYLTILESADFGFADVGCDQMLAHLRTTYGKITPEELEANRAGLTADWNPDEPIEDLWSKTKEIKRFAVAGDEPISDAAIIRLSLLVFERTGVFTGAVERWRDLDEDDWTLVRFQAHFTKANRERFRKLTAQTGGYHGAHAAIAATPPIRPAATPLATAAVASGRPAAITSTATPPFGTTSCDGQQFFYCWTHSLGTNRNHTSATCEHPADGHQVTATTRHMMGGNNTILRGGGGYRPGRSSRGGSSAPATPAVWRRGKPIAPDVLLPSAPNTIAPSAPDYPSVLAPVAPYVSEPAIPLCLPIGPPTPLPQSIIPAIADTGSTAHFCTTDAPVTNIRVAVTPISIHTPGSTILTSTHEGELVLPNLPPAACHVHIVPSLATASLLSIGQLCDAGCVAEFTADTLTITYAGSIVLTGTRTASTRLWHVHLPAIAVPPTDHSSFSAIGAANSEQLVAFAHAALFSPALSTLEAALSRGYLTNFPGLTLRSLHKHPPCSFPMVKGHLDQSRMNQRSTKPTHPAPSFPDDDTDAFPSSTLSNQPSGSRSHFCYAALMEPTGQVYADQTGRFVTPSSTGNNYLIIVYDFDSNCILAEPIKNRSAASILAGYKILHARLCAAGLRPLLQRLDNECSAALKQFFHDEEIKFQLVPPGVHRRNSAERAIRTFKNHFIAGLCSVDKHFPLHLWDRLVPQAVATLNLLRGSRLNPKLSAYAQVFGSFDFNVTPLAPPGIRVLVHEKPHNRATWSPHALDGWYIGPAMKSYRCYTVWMWDTRAERIADTIMWFPTKVRMPIASSNDLVLAGIRDIQHALSNPYAGSALAPTTNSEVAALKNLTELLTTISTPDSTPPPPLRVAAEQLLPPVTPTPTLTLPFLLPTTPAAVHPVAPLRVPPLLASASHVRCRHSQVSSPTSPPSTPCRLVLHLVRTHFPP